MQWRKFTLFPKGKALPNRGALRKIAISLARFIIKYFKARSEIAILDKRTQFAAHLRPRRVNAARMILCALKKARRKGQSPQITEK